MGSIISPPKKPKQQIVYVPTPTASTPTTPTVTSTTPTASVPDPQASASEVREKGLLSRNRGRFGTIATSFQGFLGEVSKNGGRKTLLGE